MNLILDDTKIMLAFKHYWQRNNSNVIINKLLTYWKCGASSLHIRTVLRYNQLNIWDSTVSLPRIFYFKGIFGKLRIKVRIQTKSWAQENCVSGTWNVSEFLCCSVNFDAVLWRFPVGFSRCPTVVIEGCVIDPPEITLTSGIAESYHSFRSRAEWSRTKS